MRLPEPLGLLARFSAALGQSPMQALRDIRMRQAASQLRTGDYALDQVARNVGYSSRGTFARAFSTSMAQARPDIAPNRRMPESAGDLHCLPDPRQGVPA
jgi:transcriptional regulator GlxA family with amidase domain